MKPGTIIKLTDGRIGTVVYNGLDGAGIIWGEHALTEQEIDGLMAGNSFTGAPANLSHLEPEAMLREPYPSAEIECVGKDYCVIEEDFKQKY